MVAIHRLRRERGAQANTWFYHIGDGRHYHKNVVKRRTVYFKCAHYEEGCRGRALYKRTGFVHTKQHMCRRDRTYPAVMQLRRRILRMCRRRGFVSFRDIITRAGEGYPVAVKRKCRLARMRSAMQRVRYSTFPRPPDSLEGLTAILQDPAYQHISATLDGEDNLYAASVEAQDGSHHIIFMSRRMARVAKALHTLFGDGTFKTLPLIGDLDDASQIYSINANWDHVVIPLGWVIMQRRTAEAYKAVFRTLGVLIGGFTNLEIFVSDFERALRKALSELLPEVDLQGCFFHLVNAFLRYAIEELHMHHHLRREPTKRLMMLCCALALLPEDDIKRGFQLAMRESMQEGIRTYRIMRPFFEYLRRNWIYNRIKRKWMCVFDAEHRTNNTCESHNRMLRNYIGTHHPNIYHFIYCLACMEENAFMDLHASLAGDRPNRRRKLTTICLDNRLRNLGNTLRNPPDNRDDAIMRFLSAAVYTFADAYDRAVA